MTKNIRKISAFLLIFAVIFAPFSRISTFAATLLDGTYTSSSVVKDYFEDYDPYTVTVDVTVSGSSISNITYKTNMDSWHWEENQYYVEDAHAHLLGLAKGKSTVDGIDALSGATYVSTAFIDATRTALRDAVENPGSTLITPRIAPSDARTSHIYSVDAAVKLNIINENSDGDILYTIDGSDPLTSASAVKASGSTLTIPAGTFSGNTQTTLKIAAKNSAAASEVLSVPLTFVAKDTAGGTKKYYAVKNCSFGYDVSMIVTTINGVITNVTDNQTVPGAANQIYWNSAKSMIEADGNRTIVGKTLPEVAELRTSTSGTSEQKLDAVSGATVVCNTMKYAVVEALSGEPFYTSDEQVSSPVFSTDDGFYVYRSENTSVDVAVQLPNGAEGRYTLDGSDPTVNGTPIVNGKVTIQQNASQAGKGELITLRAVSKSGNSYSPIAEQAIVFAPAGSEIYTYGTYFLDYNPGKDVDAEVIINGGIIRSIRIFDYGKLTQDEIDRCNTLLLPQIYLAQSAKITPPSSLGAAGELVLKAIAFHLDAANNTTLPQADEPMITLSDVKALYSNAEQIQVTLTTETENAEIYYTIDYSHSISGSYLSDPTDIDTERTLYTGPFNVNINSDAGGILYIRAAAINADTDYSPIARTDMKFAEKIPEGKILANGIAVNTFEDAVTLINSVGGGIIQLNADVELSKETLSAGMPTVPCTITSNGEFTLKGTVYPMIANSDLTLVDLKTNINNIYANGHNLTIDSGISTAFSFLGPNLYAGGMYSADSDKTTSGTPVVTVKSGSFTVYASGGSGTTLNGSSKVAVEGTATVSIVGAAYNSKVTGDVDVDVTGNSTKLSKFSGELNIAEIQGNLVLSIHGDPETVSTAAYTGSVLKDQFGTVNLYASSIPPELFTKFTEVISHAEPVDPDPDPSDPEQAKKFNRAYLQADSASVQMPATIDYTLFVAAGEVYKLNTFETNLRFDQTLFTAEVTSLISGVDLSSFNVNHEQGIISGYIGVVQDKTITLTEPTAVARITLTPVENLESEKAELYISEFGVFSQGNSVGSSKDTDPVSIEISYTKEPTVPMDVNGDGVVDGADISLALYYFGAVKGDADWKKMQYADINDDLIVDMLDIMLIVNAVHAAL